MKNKLAKCNQDTYLPSLYPSTAELDRKLREKLHHHKPLESKPFRLTCAKNSQLLKQLAPRVYERILHYFEHPLIKVSIYILNEFRTYGLL